MKAVDVHVHPSTRGLDGDACSYFTTVLGPGYDRAHKDHFHFDLMERRNGYKACR